MPYETTSRRDGRCIRCTRVRNCFERESCAVLDFGPIAKMDLQRISLNVGRCFATAISIDRLRPRRCRLCPERSFFVLLCSFTCIRRQLASLIARARAFDEFSVVRSAYVRRCASWMYAAEMQRMRERLLCMREVGRACFLCATCQVVRARGVW